MTFTTLPGGYRYRDGTFYGIGNYGSWWSATEFGADKAWCRTMYHYRSDVAKSSQFKKSGFSVRCVRD